MTVAPTPIAAACDDAMPAKRHTKPAMITPPPPAAKLNLDFSCAWACAHEA
jgi:hypothetical protein